MREDRTAGWTYRRLAEVAGRLSLRGFGLPVASGRRHAHAARRANVLPSRLFSLHSLADTVLLDPPDPKLDYITRLAVMAAGADIGGISLVLQAQLWMPSRVGIGAQVLPRSGSFCNSAVQEGAEWFEVSDASRDARFSGNPLVTEPPHYRHYAAVPLKGRSRHLLGTLWVMGREPRLLGADQAAQLTLMSRIVVDMLELRYCDSATGMFNRFVFLHHLERLLAQDGGLVTVGFIDLTGFRQVNDLFGRAAGDRILVLMGRRLEAWGADTALLGHLGGDRFAFALTLPPEQVEARLARLRDAIDRPFDLGNGYAQTLYGRIGVRSQQAPYRGAAAEVLDAADTAASSIRRPHECSVVCEYDSALAARTRLRYELREVIRGERRHGRLEVHYQPQIDVARGQLIGLEALVRWRHPAFGMIGPNMFIAQAESSGRIFELDVHVMELVCRDLKAWRDQGLDPVPVALNFSRVSLLHPELLMRLDAVLQETGVPGDLLELEVTESVLLDTLQPLHLRIAALRELGVRIAVDDFGTGSSNLDALDNFPFDRLKADRQFVHGVASDCKKAGLFALIQGIARVFKAELVCEGLEDEADLDWLSERGAHCVQGWLFSRARPAGDIERVLQRFRETQGMKRSVADVRALLG